MKTSTLKRRILAAVDRTRSVMPVPAKRVVRRLVDPVLRPLGSVRSVAAGNSRALALTFDDGPDPETTAGVLDALGRHGARATFFVLVERAEAVPELIQRAVAEGHEVALHGIDHRRLTRLAPAEVARLIVDGRHRLEAITRQPVRWFRPPFGAQSVATYRAARRAGLDVAVWTADIEDWKDHPVESLVATALTKATPGSLLLLHDSLADEPGQTAERPTFDRVAMVDGIVAGLAARGDVPMTLTELTAAGRPQRTAWFRP